MEVTTRPLKDARQTGRLMHKMVNKYCLDMSPYASMSLNEVFDFVKKIPFQPDPAMIELLKRPYYTIQGIGEGGDCDDKAIVMASWAKLNSIPYRFIGVGCRKPGQKKNAKILLSHVFTQFYILGEWLNVDATYSYNKLGSVLGGYDRIEVLNA